MSGNTTENGWKIRRAVSMDVDSLVTMRLRLQDHLERTNPLLLRMSTRGRVALPDIYRQRMADNSVYVAVAETHATGELVGMVVGRSSVLEGFDPSHVGRIDDVWVEPGIRRQGICRELLGHLLGFFEENDVKIVDLNYTMGNAEAENAWPNLGFQPLLIVASAKLQDLKSLLKAGDV